MSSSISKCLDVLSASTRDKNLHIRRSLSWSLHEDLFSAIEMNCSTQITPVIMYTSLLSNINNTHLSSAKAATINIILSFNVVITCRNLSLVNLDVFFLFGYFFFTLLSSSYADHTSYKIKATAIIING